jgi:hypothetical protein
MICAGNNDRQDATSFLPVTSWQPLQLSQQRKVSSTRLRHRVTSHSNLPTRFGTPADLIFQLCWDTSQFNLSTQFGTPADSIFQLDLDTSLFNLPTLFETPANLIFQLGLGTIDCLYGLLVWSKVVVCLLTPILVSNIHWSLEMAATSVAPEDIEFALSILTQNPTVSNDTVNTIHGIWHAFGSKYRKKEPQSALDTLASIASEDQFSQQNSGT